MTALNARSIGSMRPFELVVSIAYDLPMNNAPQMKKSDRTRAAILTASRRIFAEKGYEKTTIRDIAAAAEIDPALVMRYFGSKDDLFALVAEFDLNLPNLALVERSEIGKAIARHFLFLWENGDNGLPILLRSAASNETAAANIRDIFAKQVFPAVSRGVAVPSEAALRAGLVASQILGIALCRYILKIPPLDLMPRDELVERFGDTLQRYIAG